MPRRRTLAAAALPVFIAVAGSAVLAVKQRRARRDRRAAGRYRLLADMGRHDFRAVIWEGGDPAEALRLAATASPDFGRTWVEGPDGKAPAVR
jgi:hypothetical protein